MSYKRSKPDNEVKPEIIKKLQVYLNKIDKLKTKESE
jgi:hypothetical protein